MMDITQEIQDAISEMRSKGPGYSPDKLLSLTHRLSGLISMGPNTRITDIEVLLFAYRKYCTQYTLLHSGE